MKTVVSLAVFALMAAGAADAADIPRKAPPKVAPPPPPAFSWTGCYVGAQAGGGWGRKEIENDEIGGDPGFSTSTAHVGGGVAGGQIGCDYQFAGPWVIGVAGDALWANIKGTAPVPEEADEGGPGSDTFSVTNNFLGSITGRLGYSFWNTGLIYIKGGAAWAHDKYDFSNAFELAQTEQLFPTSGLNESRTGWTLGGGIEWAFAPNWSARLEYAHYDFGTKSYSFSFSDFNGFGPETFVAKINQQIDTITFGINYRFGVPFLPHS